MSQVLRNRFEELHAQMERLIASKFNRYDSFWQKQVVDVDPNALLEWRVKIRNLLAKACGEDSEHYREFIANETKGAYSTYFETLQSLRSVFVAAREDFEGGYVQDFRNLVIAEVFSDILAQASELLSSGYVGPAAVLAGAVLEDELRKSCLAAGIDLPEKPKLDYMNGQLAKANTYNKFTQKRITALAEIRNSAAHGKWTEFQKSDVEDMIRWITKFLEVNLT